MEIVYCGIIFTFIYNYFACLLRAVGNSVTPLIFLAISSVLNIVLDIWFVAGLKLGVRGAAEATVISQAVSGIGIAVFTMKRMPELRIPKEYRHFGKEIFHKVTTYSFLTCAQQSVMNFGILMIQGLVNSFGTVIMAAFAVAVKIDTLAYMPAQEFGNAFSLFISQNYGAGKFERIEKGVKQALAYLFAPNPLFGVNAIWWAIPIGWGIADVVGIMYYQNKERHKWEECVDKILKKSANLQK